LHLFWVYSAVGFGTTFMTRYPANRRVDTGTAATVLKQSDVYRSVQKQLDSGDRLHEATMEAVIADSLGLDKKVVTQVLRSVPLFIRDMLDAGFDVNWASLGSKNLLMSKELIFMNTNEMVFLVIIKDQLIFYLIFKHGVSDLGF